MTEREISHKTKAVTCCDSCGEVLYDGDTGYSLIEKIFCPACVEAALIVCHSPENTPQFTPHFESKIITHEGIQHREIMLKTAEKRTKTTANSK